MNKSNINPPQYNKSQKFKLFLNLKNTNEHVFTGESLTDRLDYRVNEHYKMKDGVTTKDNR